MSNLFPYFVLINKPVDMGSTDVVRYLKRHLPKPVDKIGHIGTLDPFAEGLLIIGVNGAQKMNEIIHDDFNKVYIARGKFGSKMSTGDHKGDVVEVDHEYQSKILDKKNLEKIIAENFLGKYFQRPHKVSAVKVNGKRLYEYHRDGKVVVAEPVLRFIEAFEILEINQDEMLFKVEVSSGTYIRVLFEDLCSKLSTVGHLTELVREQIGPIHVKDSMSRDQWPNQGEYSENFKTVSLESVFPFPVVKLSDKIERLYKTGVILRNNQIFHDHNYIAQQFYWVKGADDEYLGLMKPTEHNIKIVFNFKN